MHFLARLLRNDTAVSEELASDEQRFQWELRQFFESYKIKQEVLRHLISGEPIHLHLHKLQYALKDEISTIAESEKREKEILQDLKFLSHEHYIIQLESLLSELEQAEMRDEYTKKILSELHDVLLSEARKVKRILDGDSDPSLRQTIIDFLTIERHLVEKLSVAGDFSRFFKDLHIGTTRYTEVSHIEKRFQEKITNRVRNVEIDPSGVAQSSDDHYISELTARIFNKLERAIMVAVRDGSIEKHPNVDSEYVNSSLFERFTREEIGLDQAAGKLVPTQRTTNAFIAAFRDLYNSQTSMVAV